MSEEGLEYDAIIQDGPKKANMTTSIDRDKIREAYEDVRSDNSETEWAVFKFEGTHIVCSAKGTQFEKFREQFADDERAFGYIRLQNFAVELQLENVNEFEIDHFREQLLRAGGANYGTGLRDV